MFKRGKTDKDQQEESQWGDVEPFFDGAAARPDDEELPPSDDDAAETGEDSDSEMPFDEDDAFAPDSEADEFLEGDADDFVDDSHDDYYDYDDAPDADADDFDDGDDADDADAEDAVDGADDAEAEDEAAPVDIAAPAAAAGAAIAATPVAVASAKSAGGKHGKHGQVKEGKAKPGKQALDELPEHQRKSRRTRRILIAIIILLIAIICGLVYLGNLLIGTSHEVASQQTNQNSDVNAASNADTTKDAATVTTKKTTIPPLTSVIGKSQADAIKLLGHGATVSLSTDVNEEGNPMKKRVTAVLTDEPADTKSGTPTVYLGLNEAGQVIMAGYSAATASLGYGSLSFADAVSNEHIIEKTLNETGLNLADNTVTLPAKSTYSTYGSDGTTLVKESCSFNGTTSVGAANYTWSAVLVYDYTAANASGNLADTVRQIYVYVNAA